MLVDRFFTYFCPQFADLIGLTALPDFEVHFCVFQCGIDNETCFRSPLPVWVIPIIGAVHPPAGALVPDRIELHLHSTTPSMVAPQCGQNWLSYSLPDRHEEQMNGLSLTAGSTLYFHMACATTLNSRLDSAPSPL